jgi:hypothetical protein
MPNRDMGGLVVIVLEYMEALVPLLVLLMIDVENMN